MSAVELLAIGWLGLLIGYFGFILLRMGQVTADEAERQRQRRIR